MFYGDIGEKVFGNGKDEELLITKKKCYLVIAVGDKTFQAHKTILAPDSLFDAMHVLTRHERKQRKCNNHTRC
ncbi:Protein of unknown function [Cotesia congregata]|uniref:BTB domain-containing protein n=1 Tax=Cotesia congregata TaxID=51543 RepID=A0A8J2MLN6_COTCN|nr:Protein of unknown function [Cotesia congregata]